MSYNHLNVEAMLRRIMMMGAMMLTAMATTAQERTYRNPADYFVKTQPKKSTVAARQSAQGIAEEEESSADVMNMLFPRLSLCDWTDTMAFMVIPDRQDLVIRSFRDGQNDRQVSIMALRHKILRYAGHTSIGASGRNGRINFVTDDAEQHPYYYEIPSGTFEDYCLLKLGVPSLAYLNDVETARKVLIGKTLVTKSDFYSQDTRYGEGEREVRVEPGTEVRVVGVGVGTRSYPVKIIVEDKDSNQFFRNVAISRTNSGLREMEFEMEGNKYHTLESAFDMLGDFALPSWHFSKYVGRTVYNCRAVQMTGARNQTYQATPYSNFRIMDVKSQLQRNSVIMTLKNLKDGKNYDVELYFKDTPAAQHVFGKKALVYEDVFIEGSTANIKGIPAKHWAAIRQGKILVGFSEKEVRMVRPDDYELTASSNSRYSWSFSQLNGPADLTVTFDKRTKRVVNVK